jgi:hypothetical protein
MNKLLLILLLVTACTSAPTPPYLNLTSSPGQFVITSDPGEIPPNSQVQYVVFDQSEGSYPIVPDQIPPYRYESEKTVGGSNQYIVVHLVFQPDNINYEGNWPPMVANASIDVPAYSIEEAVKIISLEDPIISPILEYSFNLTNGTYKVTKVYSIPFDRGNNKLDADILYQGSTIRVVVNSGWCSSGGSQCYITYNLSSNNAQAYKGLKEVVCSRIENITYVMRDGMEDGYAIRYTEVLDNTTATVQANCLKGDYEKTANGITTFSLTQDSNSCTALDPGYTCGPYIH